MVTRAPAGTREFLAFAPQPRVRSPQSQIPGPQPVAQTSVFEVCGLTGDPADGAVFSRCVAAASPVSFRSVLFRHGVPALKMPQH